MSDKPATRPASAEDSVPLPGSERQGVPEVQAEHGPVDPSRRIEVTVILRRKAPIPETVREPMSVENLAANHGAGQDDMQLATDTFTRLGAEVLEADPASRRLRLAGTIETLSNIFGTRLNEVTSAGPHGAGVTHRHRTGGLRIPAVLDGIVTAVLGLDDRPQARAQFRAIPLATAGRSYTPPELGKIYKFPAGTDGAGQNVAIIELGGGYSTSDLNAYFNGLGITPPNVTAVGVDGAANQPGVDPNGADGEVMLDVEVVGALAPKAGILVYFAPNNDAGFLDAIINASHASPTPAAISISWGQSEDAWTAQARTAFDQAFADASALGVTVTAAAGDNGSADGASDGKDHADFPASSPYALACGGTRLEADPVTGKITRETVWNDGPNSATGGGFSDAFPVPVWQNGHVVHGKHHKSGKPAKKFLGRGVPDVCGVADPQTGYKVRVNGTNMVIGGTSAVAPLWAALVARLAQASNRRFGLMQAIIYGQMASTNTGFHDIVVGNNGSYEAAPGWDPCTGFGSPDGTALLAAIQSGAGAGGGGGT